MKEIVCASAYKKNTNVITRCQQRPVVVPRLLPDLRQPIVLDALRLRHLVLFPLPAARR